MALAVAGCEVPRQPAMWAPVALLLMLTVRGTSGSPSAAPTSSASCTFLPDEYCGGEGATPTVTLCQTAFCPTCGFAHKCDTSCGICTASGDGSDASAAQASAEAPSPAIGGAGASVATGGGSSEEAVTSSTTTTTTTTTTCFGNNSLGDAFCSAFTGTAFCSTLFCSGCQEAGKCDLACRFCSSPSGTASLSPGSSSTGSEDRWAAATVTTTQSTTSSTGGAVSAVSTRTSISTSTAATSAVSTAVVVIGAGTFTTTTTSVATSIVSVPANSAFSGSAAAAGSTSSTLSASLTGASFWALVTSLGIALAVSVAVLCHRRNAKLGWHAARPLAPARVPEVVGSQEAAEVQLYDKPAVLQEQALQVQRQTSPGARRPNLRGLWAHLGVGASRAWASGAEETATSSSAVDPDAAEQLGGQGPMLLEHHSLALVDGPGYYQTLVVAVPVHEGAGGAAVGQKTAELALGAVVRVQEVSWCREEQQVWARIQHPPGWICLCSTEVGNDKRWVERFEDADLLGDLAPPPDSSTEYVPSDMDLASNRSGDSPRPLPDLNSSSCFSSPRSPKPESPCSTASWRPWPRAFTSESVHLRLPSGEQPVISFGESVGGDLAVGDKIVSLTSFQGGRGTILKGDVGHVIGACKGYSGPGADLRVNCSFPGHPNVNLLRTRVRIFCASETVGFWGEVVQVDGQDAHKGKGVHARGDTPPQKPPAHPMKYLLPHVPRLPLPLPPPGAFRDPVEGQLDAEPAQWPLAFAAPQMHPSSSGSASDTSATSSEDERRDDEVGLSAWVPAPSCGRPPCEDPDVDLDLSEVGSVASEWKAAEPRSPPPPGSDLSGCHNMGPRLTPPPGASPCVSSALGSRGTESSCRTQLTRVDDRWDSEGDGVAAMASQDSCSTQCMSILGSKDVDDPMADCEIRIGTL